MIKIYVGLDNAKKAYFSHYLALRCKILTPFPYMEHIKNSTYVKSFGSFSDKDIEKIGNLKEVLSENDSFLLRKNVIRYILFCLIMGIRKPFRDVYWHKEFSEYLFVDFDRPFCNINLSKKLLRLLDQSPNEFIEEELKDTEKIIHCSNTLSLFNKYKFTDKIQYVLENIKQLCERVYVDCV